MALGSKIWLYSKNKNNEQAVQYFETTLVNGFSAQHDPRIHMAVFKDHLFDKLVIKWCGKEELTYKNIILNQYQKLTLTNLPLYREKNFLPNRDRSRPYL
jgi:hypothetical protein